MIEKKEDIPFGPAPEYYNYRCRQCKHKYEINEAITDAAIGWAEFSGEYYEGFMPILECPNCNQKTLEYIED